SNRAQTAEYLKIGTTCLIIDMIEAGFLRDAPRLEKPIQALFHINADPSLQSRVMVSQGHSLSRPEGVTALTLQRWYFEKACAFVSEQSTVSLEAREVLRVWEETLQALETSPDSLVGRVDWVTKRWLIAKLAGAEPYLVQKKVDLKYHELGRGYFDELEREGLAPRLVEPAEVEWAVAHPPQKSPAKRRGELIEQLSKSQKILVGWNEIRVGGPLRGKVIRLDDFR